MIKPEEAFKKIIHILNSSKVEYQLFNHKPVFSYKDAAEAQRETGFCGTESKCMVLKVDDQFIVYITLQGKRLNFNSIKNYLTVKKVRLATPQELKEFFGAELGCAYPFGFDNQYNIYVDPAIYEQEWLLFSPVFPTKTVQARGFGLKSVFSNVDNKVEETTVFNVN